MNRIIQLDASAMNKTRRKGKDKDKDKDKNKDSQTKNKDSKDKDKDKKDKKDKDGRPETKCNRQTLLKYIHRYQENKLKEAKPLDPAKQSFETSVKYLSELNTQMNDIENAKKDTLEAPPPTLIPPALSPSAVPVYGCLKNGSLPTYRQYQTTVASPAPPPAPFPAPSEYIPFRPAAVAPRIQPPIEAHTLLSSAALAASPAPLSAGSNKKTVKRTFRVGKSAANRKVSVLVANKSIRHQTADKNQIVKRTPIHTVRKYLIKRGLIKIGSIAPPDVLRKIYESVELMGGDITNHNADTLLHNYIHADK